MSKRKENNKTETHYVQKDDLRNELIKCKETNTISPELEQMFIKIVNGISLRFQNLFYYGIMEDVKQNCLLLLIQKYKNFDPDKETKSGAKTSPFAFLTTIVYRQMIAELHKAKKYKKNQDNLIEKIQYVIRRVERGY